ncbi:TPA: transketolase [Campylobacter lari]|nr:transketolase [Campylobacter lari]
MRNAIADIIKETAKIDPRLFLVAGDAGLGLWDDFKINFKEQYLNTGINESASIGFCSGLALSGKKPIYYNIAPFTLFRPYEQVRNDICYQDLPVILIGIGSGLTYAPAGVTHYSIEDIAVALTIPNLQIFSPCDAIETKASFLYAYNSGKPSYIRIPKNGDPIFHKNDIIDITIPQKIVDNNSEILLITHSNILCEVVKASTNLDADVYTIPFINSGYDLSILLDKYKYIFVIEESFENGSLGSYINDRYDYKIHKIGIKNHFIHRIGYQYYLREIFNLNCENLELIIKKIL